MGKAKKTRKFAVAKKMMSPKDTRVKENLEKEVFTYLISGQVGDKLPHQQHSCCFFLSDSASDHPQVGISATHKITNC